MINTSKYSARKTMFMSIVCFSEVYIDQAVV